jgi:CDP-paratose 2-epimerase
MKILITGGAGFVGSNLALFLQKNLPGSTVTCFDNLKRRGSELNLPRLKQAGIAFIHGDIRNPEDFETVPPFDLMLECSAEPSVLAGVDSSPSYVLNTNLMGTVNCLEAVRKNHAGIIFLSTSRVYPFRAINALTYREDATRFSLAGNNDKPGVTQGGITEDFPLQGPRSIYGATKLCSEFLIAEYRESYGIRTMINRCGLIAGPWQMGKIDQGVVMLWVACHLFKRELSYIGYAGTGKQVRDVLHIDDLCDLILLQINRFDAFDGGIFNVGGGLDNSISLQEMTALCREITGETTPLGSVPQTRQNDLIWYVTDNSRVSRAFGWIPKRSVRDTLADTSRWIRSNRDIVGNVF